MQNSSHVMRLNCGIFATKNLGWFLLLEGLNTFSELNP
jgi:hypothetical protein